jgi:hypothetical protein
MLVCALPCALAHETAGAARTRSSLRPHVDEGETKLKTSGKTCREVAELYPPVIANGYSAAGAIDQHDPPI